MIAIRNHINWFKDTCVFKRIYQLIFINCCRLTGNVRKKDTVSLGILSVIISLLWAKGLKFGGALLAAVNHGS